MPICKYRRVKTGYRKNELPTETRIYQKGFTRYSSPMLLVKREHQNLSEYVPIFNFSMAYWSRSIIHFHWSKIAYNL